MSPLASVIARAVAVVLTAFAAASLAQGGPAAACDQRRDQCRTACFDKYATRDDAAFARCKDACNKEWLACSSGRGNMTR